MEVWVDRLVESTIPRNDSSVSEDISVVFEVMMVENRVLEVPPNISFKCSRIN
jgi:hypothetical protein